MDICQIGYDICEFDSLRGLGIDIIGGVHFDNRDRFAIWMGSIGKATEPCQQTSGCWHLTFHIFLNLDMAGRWYEYKIFIASCTDNIYDLENERWLLGGMIDHVGIYGSRVAEGLSAFNVGLVYLGGTIGDQWAVDSAIGTGFYKLLWVFPKLYQPHMPQFYMPTIGNHRNNSKIAPISHYSVPSSTGIQWESPGFGGFICYF